jgi:MFS family permease
MNARHAFSLAFGVVCAVAFFSLAGQVRGLYGARGLAPVAEFLPQAHAALGSAALWQVPTLFWLGASDAALVAVCWLGIGLSAALAAGFAPGAMALGCWALYLSFCTVGAPFLNFQWDALLLETALLAALWLPWRWRVDWARENPVQTAGRWLLWWLLFRLMFESGVVKLAWGDRTWLEMRGLEYHFFTQPLPHWVAWYAHQLPAWLLRAGCVAVLFIEIVVPFLLIAPWRWRHRAAWALIALQVGILLTGNFAFFNWLTLALCLPLFAGGGTPSWREQRNAWLAAGAVGAFVLVATLPGVIAAFNVTPPDPLGRALGPLRSFHGYGLFRVMTTERPEIIVEGSRDGVNWSAYEFRWKPGEVYRRPAWCAPHQPRLDWQMWFAALGEVRGNPWFVRFLARLLEGPPEVLALLAKNPFPDAPPQYVRAVRYDYRFTTWGEDTAAWWRRERRDLYCPPLSLRPADGAGQISR